MLADEINESALQRKFAAIKVDKDELLKRIAAQAAAFSEDPAEQGDYRRTLLGLLISDALRPVLSGAEGHRRVGGLMDALRKEMGETAARRKRIHGLLADLGLAIDDAFDV